MRWRIGFGGERRGQNRQGDRQWMEALEPRVLLSSAEMIDFSQVVHRTGATEGEFQFQGKAGQQYLFLDLEDGGWIHVLDARGVELAVGNDDETYQMRLLWTAPANAIYTLWLDGGDDGDGGYDLVARKVGDDYGNTLAKAAPLVLGGAIQGSIEDPLDIDVFSFEANAGDRWNFRFTQEEWSIDFSILDYSGNEVITDGYDGSQAMPYSGTYYVEIIGNGEGYGNYGFSTQRVIDKEGDIDDAAPLTMGQPISGTIDYGWDHDWYWFEATAGTMYVFSDGSHGEEHAISLYGSDGKALPLYSNPNTDYDYGRGDWVIPADGRYLVKIGGFRQDRSYTLSGMIQQTADPAVASIELKPDAPISGSIDGPGGSQYFVVHAAERGTYTLSIPETSLEQGLIIAKMREGGGGTDYFDRDEPGIRLHSRYYGDSITWTAQSAGTYYFFVRSFDPLEGGTYQIQLSEELDDHGNDAQTATPLQLGAAAEGTWQYWNDEDWFKLDVVEGEQYVFNLQSDGSGWGGMTYRRRRHNGPQPPGTGIGIYDQDGTWLGSEWKLTPANLKLEWKATYSGTIYLRVSASEVRTDYRLVASTAAGDPQPARAMAIGELVEGSLSQGGDLVRLRFSPEAGKPYVINAWVGWGEWRIVAANGDDTTQKYVNFHDGCGGWGWVTSAAADYFLEVNARDATNYSVQVGEYVFSPCAHEAQEEDDEEDTQEPAPEYEGVAGMLADVGDVRDYAFNARAGQAFRFETALETLEDSWLAVYAADGTLLAQNDDLSSGWGSSEVIWKARADGVYYVRVGGYGAGSFRLLAYERTTDETPVEIYEIFKGGEGLPDLQTPNLAEHVHHQEDSVSEDLDDSDDADFWDETDWEDQL